MSDKITLIEQPQYRSPSLIPFGSEWTSMQQMAEVLVSSGFLPPDLDTANKALAVLLMGRELGVPPMQAIRGIHVVQGRPSLSAELMLALAYQNIAGFTIEVKGNEQVCSVTATRPGKPPYTSTFSITDANRAGLTKGTNWQKYPAAMLRARALSACLRVVAPDAIRGIYTPEEMGAAERDIEVNQLAEARNVPMPPTAVEEESDANRSEHTS